MNEIRIECTRCKRDAVGGLALTAQGPATGHNKERFVICADCVKALRWFLGPVEHVNGSDPVTAIGLAHISTCNECNYRYGGGAPTMQARADVARMFSDGGYAQ
jgi:hypothetical protein